MAYQSNQPRHTTPLIARPSTSRPPAGLAPPPSGAGQSFLGNAIAGALGGMGMGMGPPPMSWHVAGGPAGWGPGMGGNGGGGGPPQQGMLHPLPMAPHLSGYGQSFQPQYQQPYQGFSYPQQQFQQPYHQQPPPFAHPLPYPTAAPRTTAEGYTISSAYVPPPPAPSSNTPRQPANARSGRGGASGRGRGGGDRGGGQGQGRGPPGGQGGGGAVAKCSHAGCLFEGQRKAVREHEEDRHLIYAPGKEPKPWVGSYKAPDGVRIEGTSISLDSPEAIAKWIEERKKKWPSAKVVEVKELQRSERVAAGLEAPPRSGRGGRGGRGRGAERGGRGRGRGRGGAGSWSTRDDDEGGRDAKRAKVEPQSDGAGSESDSNSDSDDSDDDGPPVASSSKIPVEGLFDVAGTDAATAVCRAPDVGGRPTIHPSRIQAAKAEEEEAGEAKPAVKEFQVVCKPWRKGNCALGDTCPYLHSLPPNSSIPSAPSKRKRPAPPAPPHNPFARPDPFAQLAERDIAHVVSDVLYALEFFQQNDWLRGVESRVGELDEEGGIEELPTPAAGIEVLTEASEPLVPEEQSEGEGTGVLDSDDEMGDSASGDELEISRNE